MHQHETLIAKFYEAFQRKDHQAMAECYHPDVHFSDPVFRDLKGDQARAMWHMLCRRGKDLQISFSEVQADDSRGQAVWVADYTFSRTGRKVHNEIQARFRFQEGLIIEHIDTFDLPRWMAQALGLPGKLFGSFAPFQNKLRRSALAGLQQFTERE